MALYPVTRPLVERALLRAYIGSLEQMWSRLDAHDAQAAGEAAALRKEIVSLSTRFRVLSEQTALLVLETEEDYVRFQIDRKALADILTVGERGIELSARSAPVFVAKQGPPLARQKNNDRALHAEIATKLEASSAASAEPATEQAAPSAAGTEESAPETANRINQTATIFGRDSALGRAAADALGGLVGAEASEDYGAGGLGLVGSGRGGTGDGGRGLGNLGTIGRGSGAPSSEHRALRRQRSGSSRSEPPAEDNESPSPEERTPAYSGRMAEVMQLLQSGRVAPAWELASKWRNAEPGDILALVALGEVAEARGDRETASRAYGSMIDLFPSRADLRRFAGERLERLGEAALELAADTYGRALEQRPDHPSSHRLLAFVLLRKGDLAGAFTTLEGGAGRQYPQDRFRGAERILREDLGLIGAAWIKKEPSRRKEIEARLAKLGAELEQEPSLRFVLNWETDANDVDFHIHDGRRGHAFYANPALPSGGSLYDDVTTGYGPECFNVPGKAAAFPYKLEAHYYSRGPMGYGIGKLEIIQHDGHGTLKLAERPFVVMNDRAFVDLGILKAPL